MKPDSLRRNLYLGTRDLHDALDQSIGAFADRDDYARYLLGTLQFRAALEPALEGGDFAALELVGELRRDLADLGLAPSPEMPPLALDTHEAKVAALYVSEGSAVGARLISRKAAELGLDDGFGARHLAQQTADRARWPAFLEWLEAQDVAQEAVVHEARKIFTLAKQAYRVDA
ncbi:biliverdin-producing heme oxygenase [Paracoccus litorisediminis]|uniref:Heme oxygenase n=1 Tax=Paracoccus litorisediminis TaxID=2006130 RepID=A0A844HWK9_9RHOB|nr:biliverdin-producing heme oxygenase [Paracoccus litorisediminis]MTH61852.1 hypothetical protein [Paracoccus litorisediminis]